MYSVFCTLISSKMYKGLQMLVVVWLWQLCIKRAVDHPCPAPALPPGRETCPPARSSSSQVRTWRWNCFFLNQLKMKGTSRRTSLVSASIPATISGSAGTTPLSRSPPSSHHHFLITSESSLFFSLLWRPGSGRPCPWSKFQLGKLVILAVATRTLVY